VSPYFTRQINAPEKQAFWTLSALLLCAVFLYVYFVQSAIHTIVRRTDIIEQTKNSGVTLAELEAEHNKLRTLLTYDYARARGFDEATEQAFAKRARLAQNSTDAF